jgi:hypothetical protein
VNELCPGIRGFSPLNWVLLVCSSNCTLYPRSRTSSLHSLVIVDPLSTLSFFGASVLPGLSLWPDIVVDPIMESPMEFPLPVSLLLFVRDLDCRGSQGDLAMQNFEELSVMHVPRLPSKYDGDIMFELPPLDVSNDMKKDILHYDGHPWLLSNHIGMSNLPDGVKVRKSMCASHLRCINEFYTHLLQFQSINCQFWRGSYSKIPEVGCAVPTDTFRCWFYNESPLCVARCPCRIYSLIR